MIKGPIYQEDLTILNVYACTTTAKMSTLQSDHCMFSTILIKIPTGFSLPETNRLSLQFISK